MEKNYSELTNEEKNNIVSKYEPLINKITKQYAEKIKYNWEDIKSMAYEGLVLALIKYDKNKSNMNFTQYAAFSIRNNILTSLDNELRVVKLSNYAQKKTEQAGNSLFNTVSISDKFNDENDKKISPKEIILKMYEDEKFSNGDIFNYLKIRLEEEFSLRDCIIFYKAFGLNGYEELKGKEIAEELNISKGLVSQRLKNIINFIKKDRDLCEMLSNL